MGNHKMWKILLTAKSEDALPVPIGTIRLITLKIT